MNKKFLLSLIICFMMISSIANAENFVPIADGVGAWQFLHNWGYESCWDKNNTMQKSTPGMITYFAFIPSASSGLGDVGGSMPGTPASLGVVDMVTFPDSGEVCGIRFVFNNRSPNPNKTMGDAFAAIIGINNFNIDKSKFDYAFSQVMSGSKYAVYYSENMRRSYMIAYIKSADDPDFYKMAITAFN